MKLRKPAARTSDVVELRIPAQAEWVAVARLAVAAVANRIALTFDDIEDVKLAVSEAATLCIRERPTSTLEVRCEVDPEGMTIVVRDAGAPVRFDAPARTIEAGDERDGLGIVLIESLMDTVDRSRDPATGLEIRMRKRIVA